MHAKYRYTAHIPTFLQAWGKPEWSTPLRAISHRSVELSFHTYTRCGKHQEDSVWQMLDLK